MVPVPTEEMQFGSSNGARGLFWNAVTICPVFAAQSCTSPASLTVTPETGSSATMYIATRLPNGFASCSARYTAPSAGLAAVVS